MSEKFKNENFDDNKFKIDFNPVLAKHDYAPLGEGLMVDRQAEEWRQEHKNEYKDDLMDLEKTDSLQASKEKEVENKVDQSFPVTKEKVNAPEGDTPEEPEHIELTGKFDYLVGKADADYDNVMATWGIYINMPKTTHTQTRIRQLENVERNSSRYTRFKFFVFDKKSIKYQRYAQIKKMNEHAKNELPKLKKLLSRQPKSGLEYNDPYDVRMKEALNTHALPVRILSKITGFVAFGVKAIGSLFARRVLAQQNPADVQNKINDLSAYEEMNKHAQFFSMLFQKKYSAAEKQKLIAMDDEISNQTMDDEFDTNLVEDIDINEEYTRLTNVFNTLIADQKALLKLYQKGKKKNAEAIAQLESQISTKTKAINDHNEMANNAQQYQLVINTTDAYNLHEELNKYREN